MKNIYNVPTPFNIIYNDIIQHNIKKMQIKAQNNNSELWPHFKTHKSLYIANMQIENGASGITVSKLGEAEILAKAGIKKIILAYPVVGNLNMHRLANLLEYIDISIIIDNMKNAKELNKYAEVRDLNIPYFFKIDTGLGRLGVAAKNKPENIIISIIKKYKNLKFIGILTHTGNTYACENIEEIIKAEKKALNDMHDIKKNLIKFGITNIKISIGDTPGLSLLEDFQADIIRPGNYVFYDAAGVENKYCKISDCGFRTISQIISVKKDRIVIDAGSKTLGLDKGAHGNNNIKGHGLVINSENRNERFVNAHINSLSEEHGVLNISSKNKFKEGDIIEIIPNHSCSCVNLLDFMYLVDANRNIIEKIKVDARGCVS